MAVHGHVEVRAAPHYEGGQWLFRDEVHENTRERAVYRVECCKGVHRVGIHGRADFLRAVGPHEQGQTAPFGGLVAILY